MFRTSFLRPGVALLCVLALLVGVVPVSPAAAASRKLSEVTAPGGRVLNTQISPNGAYFVYQASYEDNENEPNIPGGNELLNLYAVPLGGGTVVQLNAPIVNQYEDVGSFAITPDSTRVIFSTNRSVGERPITALFSVSITGGTPVRLDPTTNPFRNPPGDNNGTRSEPFTFKVTPDSSRVVFRADLDVQNRPELYSVPVAGGAAAVKLSPAQTNLETNRAGGFVFSSDGSQVLFAWSNGQIYRIPPTGGTPTSLTPSVIFPSFVNASAVSSTGYVIYGTGTSSSQDQELYSIPLTGGSATLLNSTFGGGFSFLPEPLLVSADGSRVIYQTTTGLASSPVAGGSAATLATFSASQSLYGVKVGGGRVVYAFRDTGPAGTVISIASVPVAGGSTATLASGLADDFFQYDIVGNGTQVAYVGRTAPETRNGLFVVPTTGGVVTTLDDPSVTSHATRYIESSPTANRVAYVVRAANGIEELYSTPLAGGPRVKLNGPMSPNFPLIQTAGIAPDNSRVVYITSDSFTSNEINPQIYSVPLAGGTATLLDASRAIYGDVQPDYQVSSDGKYAVYIADAERNGVPDLYSVALAGGAPVKLNAMLGAASRMSKFQISANGQRVVFFNFNQPADPNAPRPPTELYSVPIAGGTAVKLEITVPNGQFLKDFQISPDSAQVVYNTSDGATPENSALFSIPIVGGNVTQLATSANQFIVSPNSSRVVYVGTDQNGGLYSVPLAGGNPTTLTPSTGQFVNVLDFQVSSDSSRVVYTATIVAGGIFATTSLASVPLAGGTSTTLDTLTAGGAEFEITSDSSRVVYTTATADEFAFTKGNLNSIPIAGGTKATFTDLQPEQDVRFALSADGSRLVYLVRTGTPNGTNNTSLRLFSAPVTGGTGITLFDLPNIGFGSMDFAISPDGSQVAYANPTSGQLFGIPSGGGTAVALSPAGQRTQRFTFIKNSLVLFQANQGDRTISNLYAVPPAGGTVQQINGTIAGVLGVQDFLPLPDGSLVVYRGDETKPNVSDLYVADFGPPTVNFSSSNQTVNQKDGTVKVTVQLGQPGLQPVTLNYTVTGGTAVEGVDFNLLLPADTAPTRTLTFAPGETSKTIDIRLLNPAQYRGTRTLVLTLSNPQGGTLGSQSNITLTIEDDLRAIFLPLVRR